MKHAEDHAPRTVEEALAEVRREFAIRRNVYPGFVRRGRMTQDEADEHMARLAEAGRRLAAVRDAGEAQSPPTEIRALFGVAAFYLRELERAQEADLVRPTRPAAPSPVPGGRAGEEERARARRTLARTREALELLYSSTAPAGEGPTVIDGSRVLAWALTLQGESPR